MNHNLKTWLAAAVAAIAALVAAVALVTFGPPAHAGGQASVSFIEPQNFSDAGRATLDRERTQKALAEHFERLAARLPDGQTLRIEVLDVDLAGEQHPLILNDVRVLRGRIDWPRMTLRWSLVAGGRTLRTGEERLADMGYPLLGGPRAASGVDLPYERRMLDRWFGERFGAPR